MFLQSVSIFLNIAYKKHSYLEHTLFILQRKHAIIMTTLQLNTKYHRYIYLIHNLTKFDHLCLRDIDLEYPMYTNRYFISFINSYCFGITKIQPFSFRVRFAKFLRISKQRHIILNNFKFKKYF